MYPKKYLNLIKKGIISIEKMVNSGNYNNDYAHSFFGKDFSSKPLYWCSEWFQTSRIKSPRQNPPDQNPPDQNPPEKNKNK